MNLLITELLYQKIFECLDEAIAVEDSNGMIIQVNEMMCQVTGFPKEDWISGHQLYMIIADEWKEEYHRMRERFSAEQSFEIELFVKRKNQQGFWALIKSRPLLDEQGFFMGRIITLKDITKNKKQLTELKSSDERFRFLLEASSEGIVIHEKGIITDANDAALKMLGYEMKDVIGKSIFDFAPAGDHGKIAEAVRTNLQSREVREVLDKQQKIHHVEVSGKTVNYEGKEMRVILVKDVSELQKKRIEEERLISILEASPFIVAMIYGDGLRYMNRAGRQLLGYGDREDISHLEIKDLVNKESEEMILKTAIPAAVRGDSWKGHSVFKTKDGREIHTSQTILAHVDQNNDLDFFSTIAEDISERKLSEQSLMISRERLKYFVEESREAIVIHENGIIVDFNNAAQKMFGYSMDELAGKEILKLYDTSFHKELKQKLILKDSFLEELMAVRKDGTRFDVEVFSRPRIYKGNEVRVMGILDITSRKSVERALRSSEVRLNAAVEGTQVGIWDWNLITNTVGFNEALRRIYDYKAGNTPVYFDEWKNSIHPDDLPELLNKLRMHLYGETPMFQHVYRARRAHGGYIVFEAKGKLVRDENNMPVRIVGTAVDITERQMMEDALRKNQAELSALIENREEAIWSVDLDLRLLNFNKPISKTFHSFWGVTMKRGELITKDLPKEMADLWVERYARSMKGASYVIVDRFEHKGQESFVECSLNPIRIDDGSIIGVSVLARNITKQKSFEKSLQEAKESAESANRTKSQFLANMSHEIRTPMNGIIGFADLLLQSRMTAQQREYLDIVRYSADSLLTLINDLLDISKIESGKLGLVNKEFNLHNLLREAVRSFKVKAKDQNLKIKLKVDSKIPTGIIGDEMRYHQVMLNLIGNAVKFSKEGDISIRSFLKEQKGNIIVVQTEISDQGIGIEKEKQKMIFEPFNQIDNSFTRKYGGTGLGLSIAKKLVNMMGGDIHLDSEPGKGSRFYFTVQLEIPHADKNVKH